MKNIVVICGATASGKTAIAIELAKKINGEIISADSMNIYKGLDVGTAKPTKKEQAEINHYLIDVIEPTAEFSVSDYKKLATQKIEDILKSNKVPIIVGGTGFYINSLLYNMSYGLSGKDDNIRLKYQQLYDEHGADYVYELLKKVDYESYLKLHKNDIKRVIRALEIYELTGTKKSSISDNLIPNYNFLAFSVNMDRNKLYNRIDNRVDVMINNSLINEVKQLLNNGVDKNNQSMQGIGYKETIDYLEGKCNLEELKNLIKLNTRHYAKRQITYFKKLNNHILIEDSSLENMLKKIIEHLREGKII